MERRWVSTVLSIVKIWTDVATGEVDHNVSADMVNKRNNRNKGQNEKKKKRREAADVLVCRRCFR